MELIFATEPLAYYFGMKPNEFWDSRYHEIKVYCEVNLVKTTDDLKKEINLQEAVTNKLIAGDCMNQNARITLVRDSYPNLFEEQEQSLEEQRRIMKG